MNNYKQELAIQKLQLKLALGYAESIEACDAYISDGVQVDYYKAVRTEAIEKYVAAVGAIVEQSVEIAAQFQTPKVSSTSLFEAMASIAKDHAHANGIEL